MPGEKTAEQKPVEASPVLKLDEIKRSSTPVVEQNDKVQYLMPWRNYSIVMPENSEASISVWDQNGQKVPGTAINRNVSVSWSPDMLGRKLGKTYYYVSANQPTKDYTLNVKDLPPELRSLALKTIYNNSGQNLTSEKVQRIAEPTTSAEAWGKYLIFRTVSSYFAYDTEDASGIVQPPNRWKRLDPTNQLPEDLSAYMGKVLEVPSSVKQINSEYSTIVTEVGINFVKNGEENGKPVFSQDMPGIQSNVLSDPANPGLVFYCPSENPTSISRIDTSASPDKWHPATAELPKKYSQIRNLQLDPSGRFFLFYEKNDLVIMTREGLSEVKRVPGLTQVNFDQQGDIRAIDGQKNLVILRPGFDELGELIEQQRREGISKGFQAADIFQPGGQKVVAEEKKSFEHLAPIINTYEVQLTEALAKVGSLDGVAQLRKNMAQLKQNLLEQRLSIAEADYVLGSLSPVLAGKEKEIAGKEAAKGLETIEGKMSSGLSLMAIGESRETLQTLAAVDGLLDEATRARVREVTGKFEQQSSELFRVKGAEIKQDVDGLLAGTKEMLSGFGTRGQMDDWLEYKYPQLKARLGSMANSVPLEAQEAYKIITGARAQLDSLRGEYETKFKQQYAIVREKAAERMESTVRTLAGDIQEMLQRLQSKNFASRQQAETYLLGSGARISLEEEIRALQATNPDAAKELEKALKVSVSNTLAEIERGGRTTVADSGQQMVMIGETAFPVWEAKVKERTSRQVELVFVEDKKSRGPGVKPNEILGDAAIKIRGADGKWQEVGLYAGKENEDEWRLGVMSYRGEGIPPSYMTVGEYKKLKSDYLDWGKGEGSKLRQGYDERKKALRDLYKTRQRIGERTEETDAVWRGQYEEKLKDYASFVAENHIILLTRVDQIKSEPDVEKSNGKGFVPKWQSHWVLDEKTLEDLEQMAKTAKMQLELQEGMLGLKGHAGSGKDVLAKMFCSLTHRPYFGFDCSKWTTEFELSEDVTLEAEGGATYTIKIPSVVLSGIRTPGAVVYFNEFSAMPEQAQIFLHSLMDEKRSMTLKTSAGETIKADPSVILMSSWNPGYPGTFDIQFATRSRIVSQEIQYCPLTRPAKAEDQNKNPVYESTEALRIAREVESLSDLTYEANMERNEFVKMWDKYVNGIDNGAPAPNATQKFDIETIMALVQFGDKIRTDFVSIFEKSRNARQALPITQPLTGREYRRCAFELSKIKAEDKVGANPEAKARELLARFYLTHVDKNEDRQKIETAMASWTSKKRVGI